MKPIERQLSELHGKDQACLVGNGTIGLVAAIKVLGLEGRRVGIPNNVCFSIPQAVIYAGAQPVYLDVEAENFGLSSAAAAKVEGLSALIAVHAFGCVCSIDRLLDLCREKGWYLIEDFCVAQGAASRMGSVGRFGDVSVTSFGAGKIIDIGHGGAVLTDNLEWANEIKHYNNSLPIYNEAMRDGQEMVGRLHTELYNTQFLQYRQVDSAYFQSVVESQRKSYFYRWSDQYLGVLEHMLNDLPTNLERRRINARRLAERLRQTSAVKVIEHGSGDVYWRLNLFVEKCRDELLRILLDKQLPVSSWHPPVDRFIEPGGSYSETPVTDEIGEKIINLWVNDQVDDSYIDKVSTTIDDFFR